MNHTKSVLLGAALVMIGFLMGRMYTEPQVSAQTVTEAGLLIGKVPALVTSSADGLTIHIWSFGPLPALANPLTTPHLVKTITETAK